MKCRNPSRCKAHESAIATASYAIQTVAHRENFTVVREYGGHGIGTVYHDELHVPHYGQTGKGLKLECGMIFTIEPMINAGAAAIRQLSDGYGDYAPIVPPSVVA